MIPRMIPEPDPVPEEEPGGNKPDCPDMPVLISVDDFYDLLMKVQQIVEERVGIKLEPEIRILGEPA